MKHRWLALIMLIAMTVSAKQREPKAPTNKLMSFNFQDVPVSSLLQMIADHNGFNLVLSDSIQGNLTLHLEQVTWQQALDTILQIKNLAKRQVGNVLLIAPQQEIAQQESVAPLQSTVIQINHANAESLAKILTTDKQNYQDYQQFALLSKRGSVAIDERTNSLIIKDIAKNLASIKRLIASLDIPIEQVEIEAKIVSVDQGTLQDIGVEWGVTKNARNYRVGAQLPIVDQQLNVDFSAVSPNAASAALQVVSLSREVLLDLELSALQAESRAEIISSPKLLTTNKRPAYIEQGTELPYLEASSSGATSVTYKKAVLSLAVTPQITNDNKLVLDLNVTQDRPAATVQAGTGEAVSINTQRISTQVLVENGETLMLGGIYQNEVQNIVEKVPLLGDIPIIGVFFRRQYETLTKKELLIFVTPRIVVQ